MKTFLDQMPRNGKMGIFPSTYVQLCPPPVEQAPSLPPRPPAYSNPPTPANVNASAVVPQRSVSPLPTANISSQHVSATPNTPVSKLAVPATAPGVKLPSSGAVRVLPSPVQGELFHISHTYTFSKKHACMRIHSSTAPRDQVT